MRKGFFSCLSPFSLGMSLLAFLISLLSAKVEIDASVFYTFSYLAAIRMNTIEIWKGEKM